jgi:hypothetical protein
MTDVTVASFDDMEPIFEGVARRARATLGISSFGMQVYSLPPNWDGYPEHDHGAAVADGPQEEVYVPIAGAATLVADSDRFDLAPGMMARVGPEQRRRVLPGPAGIRMIVIGGAPGAFRASQWTELGGPLPGAG